MQKNNINGFTPLKNELNLTFYQYITTSINTAVTAAINNIPNLLPGWYFSPTTQGYNQGTLANGVTYTEYTFTVPAKCQYFTVLLVGAGGAGGSFTRVVSTRYVPCGGGGAGAWARLLIPKSAFTAGSTQYKIRVGHAANASASWYDLKGGNTALLTSGGVNIVTCVGGNSAANDDNTKPRGTGGTLTGSSYIIEYGNGQDGEEGQEMGEKNNVVSTYSWDGRSGAGGYSPFGNAGAGQYVEENLAPTPYFNGRAASGFGAGGSGGIANNGWMGAGTTAYGGNGAAGYAEVTFYYQ